ncbi:MAG: NfeD family protein [Gemmobacter sp.]
MIWWGWVVLGLVLAGLELFAPGYLFLGFAVGGVVTGGLVWAGVLGATLPVDAVVFAALSVAAWFGMRRALGTRAGQVKRIDRDINDN